MFIHIPTEVAERTDLNITDKYVAGVIIGLTKKNGFCHATNSHIAEQVQLLPKSISRIISQLATAGVISVEVSKEQDERGHWKTTRLIRTAYKSPLPSNEDTPSAEMRNINNKIENKKENINERPIVIKESKHEDSHISPTTAPPQKEIKNNLTRADLTEWWNKRYNKKFRASDIDLDLFDYWCMIYSDKEIKVAIGSHPKHPYWSDKLTPMSLFKKTDSKGQPMNVINQLLTFETDDPQVLRFRDALKEGQ